MCKNAGLMVHDDAHLPEKADAVLFKPKPLRIASLTCSNTEILAALGWADALCAVDSHSDFPADPLQGLPRLGPDLDIDMEALVRSRPDLVLASHSVPGMEKVTAALEKTGLPFLLLDPTSWQGVLDSIRTVAEHLDIAAAGEEAIANMQGKVQELKNSLPSWATPPKVLVEWWPRPVIVATRDSWITDMLHLLGAENAFVHLSTRSSPVTTEQVLEARPDLLVCSWCGVKKLRPEVIQSRAGWQDLPAVQHRRVFAIPESGLGRPGPRLLEGMVQLRDALLQLS